MRMGGGWGGLRGTDERGSEPRNEGVAGTGNGKRGSECGKDGWIRYVGCKRQWVLPMGTVSDVEPCVAG